MDLAFYTCFYGDNKNPGFKIPEIPSQKYKCYYYTNNITILDNLKNTQWIPIYDDKPISKNLTESSMFSKHIKSCPHEYEELKKYSYLCFLDSKLEKINEIFIEEFINKYFIEKNYALLLREHPTIKNNVWNEYNESMHQLRYRNERKKYRNYINKQISDGLSEITEHHCITGLLIRNMKHEKINDLNTIWYKHILECGIQCQISFFFVKQLFKDYILSFTENPFIF